MRILTQRNTRSRAAIWILAPMILLSTSACMFGEPRRDLGPIYNEAAQLIGEDRNPVLVIPGILGSKLESPETMTPVWGSFTYGAADTDTPEGARLLALPMKRGVSLRELQDEVVATEVLDRLKVDVAIIRGLELSAYVDILKTLGAGRYRDSSLGESGAIDYAGLHYTCFQNPYDWRRDISEQAAALHQLVLDALSAQPTPRDKVDIVAHSMGGLVLRYYLRYGPDPLPEDGSLPVLDWEGAQYVENAILIGTPSAGSLHALKQLVEGVEFASFVTPKYRAGILGTMPSIYQLLPRTRHARVVDRASGRALDLFDAQTWIDNNWGLADPSQMRVLRQLLPDARDDDERRDIAIDHLRKSLAKAAQLHRALDIPASPPQGTSLHLVAGDAIPTLSVLEVSERGTLITKETSPGDNTVTRHSALMDERIGDIYTPRLRTPIAFESYLFLEADHLGLTRDPLFENYILFNLLERPTTISGPRRKNP